VLIGRTVDAGRVWDVVAAARYLAAERNLKVWLAGEGAGGVLAAYAAILEADIGGVVVVKPPGSHMETDAPQLLNILRVCDVAEALGMLAPRPLQLLGAGESLSAKVKACYAAADASGGLETR
jgi:pimeloyl-ACP methyl ester carboxylesterase